MQRTVKQYLDQSGGARATDRMDLGGGREIVLWENENARVRYERPKNHTFSLYLKDGTGTRRLDAGGVSGFPGAVCVMPAGHTSDWEITTPFRFVHLYLANDTLGRLFSEIHDRDVRCLNLAEMNFVKRPDVAQPLMTMAQAAMDDDALAAEAAVSDLVGALPQRQVPVTGGLAPHVMRLVDDYVTAHLADSITLEDLAALAGVSSFHFHRMFRKVRGCTPQTWITSRRVDHAKALLRTDVSICEAAMSCGFCSQSHLTRVFRAQTGQTPAQFREHVGHRRSGRSA